MQRITLLTAPTRKVCYFVNIMLCVLLLSVGTGWAEEGAASTLLPKKLLIVNFKNMAEVYGEGASIKSPISNRIFRSGIVGGNAADILTSLVIDIVKEKEKYHIVSSSKTPNITSNLVSKSRKQFLTERKLLVETGRRVGADFVMAGYVYRFRERKGRDFAAERPASVAFGVHLLRVRDGRVMWSRHFDQTQKALSDNLFEIGTFFKRGGKWVTAEEMARIALKDMI